MRTTADKASSRLAAGRRNFVPGFAEVDTGSDWQAGLRQKVAEATFVADFVRDVNADLEPDAVCAAAARRLHDFFRYKLMVLSLSPMFGGKSTSYIPEGRGGKSCELVAVTRHLTDVGKEGRDDDEGSSVLSTGGEGKGKRYVLKLPGNIGYSAIFLREEDEGQVSDNLLSSVAECLAGALKNASEFGKAKELAMRDGLTGLFNRRVLEEMLAIEGRKRDQSPLSLLIIDLDDFKVINDTYGHPAGDQVLTEVSRILMDNFRGSDLVARYGGEEFAVLLPNTTASAAFQVGQRLRRRLAETTFTFDGHLVRVTASMGIANCTGSDRSTVSELLKRSDQALYRAKKNGKNRIYIYSAKSPFDQEEIASVGPRKSPHATL